LLVAVFADCPYQRDADDDQDDQGQKIVAHPTSPSARAGPRCRGGIRQAASNSDIAPVMAHDTSHRSSHSSASATRCPRRPLASNSCAFIILGLRDASTRTRRAPTWRT
jgi:hypothetical protein